ncbi:RIP metalloprotease RseP [Apilactobacillus sp. TMW 2.2459]|uniref:RIP metalloprotease RseP n=1 Tax=Apilactobacillus xinyiensis TaxID=2841032 RepID=UPI0020101EBA|nr:RIP metalloprotease RseP [Apilactobacillus xinyiensis]MCL0311616.1 RIP metalloprotease RseP [Apilactobacillus xinyiensis]
MITTIIAFIIVFGLLVIVHEFGHFIVAKKSGIMVREFSIGMGPKIFYYRKNNTTYTWRLLPLGGYVRMAGSADNESQELKPGTPVSLKFNSENNEVVSINTSHKQTLFNGVPLTVTKADLENKLFIEGFENADESEKKTFKVNHDATIIEEDGTEVQIAPEDVQFQNAPLFRRILTNFAGVFNNVLLAIVAFTIVAFLQGGVSSYTNQVNLASSDSVAAKAGLKNNDKIVKVNNTKISNWYDLTKQIQSKPNQNISMQVERNNESHKINLKTGSSEYNNKKVGVIGITQTTDNSFMAKLTSGFTQTWRMTTTLVSALYYMIVGHFSLNDLGGPVAIFASTSQAAKLGVLGVVNLLAFLSINLAIMNLIPIPALDGGKILLNIIEAIRRKPVSEKVETIITIAGAIFLLVLMLLVTFNDIQRYFIR